MVKLSVRQYPEREMNFPFKPTGKTRVVTSYTTFEEMAAHDTPSGCKFIGTDTTGEGPKNKPILVWRVFERCKKVPKRRRRKRRR